MAAVAAMVVRAMPHDALDPPPVALLDDPLAYFLAAHHLQRVVCQRLHGFAAALRVPRKEAGRVSAYLTEDLALHHEDEDLDLYPALRRRAVPADGLGPTLARLGREHHQGLATAAQIAGALAVSPAEAEVVLDAGAAAAMQDYAASELRHLAIENAVVLALARIRLKRPDLLAISRNMKARRGIKAP